MVSPWSRAEFRFVAGRAGLDFANTLVGRGDEEADLLATAPDLGVWLHRAGLTASVPSVATHELSEAVKLREAISRSALAASTGSVLAPQDVRRINLHARYPVAPLLDGSGETVSWEAPRTVAGALSRMARDAVELLGGEERFRIRMCAREGCGALFLDRSRRGTRRWCSLVLCGNRAKVATYRHTRSAGSRRRRRSGA